MNAPPARQRTPNSKTLHPVHFGGIHNQRENYYKVNEGVKSHIRDSHNRWKTGRKREAPYTFNSIFPKYVHNLKDANKIIAMIHPTLHEDGVVESEIRQYMEFIELNTNISLRSSVDASIDDLLQSLHGRISALESKL